MEVKCRMPDEKMLINSIYYFRTFYELFLNISIFTAFVFKNKLTQFFMSFLRYVFHISPGLSGNLRYPRKRNFCLTKNSETLYVCIYERFVKKLPIIQYFFAYGFAAIYRISYFVFLKNNKPIQVLQYLL